MLKNETRTYAFISGCSLLLMAILAGFSYGYVFNNAVVENAQIQTAQWINQHTFLFKLGILGWVLILILDVIVSLSLYQYPKTNQPKLSALTAGLRLLYTACLGVAIFHLVQALEPKYDSMQVFEATQLFKTWWSKGLIVFGLHLIALGITGFKSRQIPRFWSGLLVFAGFAYFGIHTCQWTLTENHQPMLKQIEMILSLPMALSELGLGFWLIWKGGK